MRKNGGVTNENDGSDNGDSENEDSPEESTASGEARQSSISAGSISYALVMATSRPFFGLNISLPANKVLYILLQI